ncbi:membrane protein [Streptomyces sp. 150FB]|nr:membrane protein [Streptomyces sp. 150FB]
MAGALFAAYTALSVLRWRRMETRSWDLGIFEQAIRAYARLQAPVADLKGPGANILGDHFSPVIALLAPAYRVFPTPATLLVAQSALFAVSAIPVTRASVRLLGRAPGAAIGVAYGLSWGIQRAADSDFHEICFAVPLIAFSLEALLAGRWRAALLWALPLVLVKEDLGLTVSALAVVVLIRARRVSSRAVTAAVAVAVFGVVATLITVTVVIPAFTSADAYGYWGKIGGDGSVTDGLLVKLRTLLWLLLPTTGLLAVRSPLALVLIPTLGWRFVSGEATYWGTDWHYNAVLMPVLALALADALTAVRDSPRRWLWGYANRLPACAAAAALALTTALPLSALTDPATYRKSPEVSAREAMLRRIPDGSTVESDVGPISQLTSRCRVFWVGDAKPVRPDFIAVDNVSGWLKDPPGYARQLHPDARYTVVGSAGGYLLLQRVAAG